MIEYEANTSEMRITIPISNIGELIKYQNGILGLLSRIEIGDCDPKLKEEIKSVYELLSHLTSDRDSLSHRNDLGVLSEDEQK